MSQAKEEHWALSTTATAADPTTREAAVEQDKVKVSVAPDGNELGGITMRNGR